MLSERFFLNSPFGNEKDGYLNDSSLHRVFTLDSPVPSPDLNHNGFTPNLHTSLGSKNTPNGTPGYGLQLGKDYKTTPSEDLSTKQGARSSVDKSESVLTPMFTSKIGDNDKDFWMTSNGTTPKGEAFRLRLLHVKIIVTYTCTICGTPNSSLTVIWFIAGYSISSDRRLSYDDFLSKYIFRF
jgi:hypothetical protein